MHAFDDVLTDAELRPAAVEEFVADLVPVGKLQLGRFSVWTTSGTTGVPGIFVHDAAAATVYQALVPGCTRRSCRRSWFAGGSQAAAERPVFVTGGHFAGTFGIARAQRQHPRLAAGSRLFSVLEPLPILVRELQAFRPAMLAGYPSGPSTTGALHSGALLGK